MIGVYHQEVDDFWLWLYSLPNVGSRSVIRYREQCLGETPGKILSRLGNTGKLSEWKMEVGNLKCQLQKEGVSIVPYWADTYPALLKEIADYPAFLFCSGDVDLLSREDLVTIVGTRDMSEYGRNVVADILGVLIEEGVSIVSGLANGVDREAHAGILSRQRTSSKPVAVLPGGPKGGFPERNRELFEQIVDRGCAVWEFVPNTPVQPGLFALRNRILAGLTRCTVVVESDQGGGSLITARSALESDRDVGAVPGSVYSPVSRGTNRLIRDGAYLIRDGWDVKALLCGDLSEKETLKEDSRLVRVVRELKCPAKLSSKFTSLLIEQGIEVSCLVDYSVLEGAALARVLTKLEIAGILRRDFDGKIKLMSD